MKVSIKYKFAIGFIIIFSISTFVLNYFIGNSIKKNTKAIINNDMAVIQKNTREYLKQFFVLEGLKATGNSLEDKGKKIAYLLSENTNCITSIYTIDGKFICQSMMENTELIINSEDNLEELKYINLAKQDMSAAFIENFGEKLIVNFSYPLYIDGKGIGIIRFTKDYTDVYTANKKLLDILTIFTFILFLAIFIFSYLLSIRVIKPIEKLSKAFNEVAEGNYDVKVNLNGNDEIGELSRDFYFMKDKIEEQIETIKQEKERVVKLEKHRREFFNNVTHELKTPLTSIFGYAQILSEEGFEDREFYNRAIGRIMDESQRLHRMVVDVLEVSKRNSYLVKPEFKKLDLRDLVNEICQDISMKAEKYKMNIIVKADSMEINGDRNGLREIFINVIDNAVKYGEIGTDICVTGYKNDGYGILKVENKGEKIPKDKLDKIFEPFFRVNSKTKEKGSSGLGLYISKEIVKEHNGDIWVENNGDIIKVFIKIPLWQQIGNNNGKISNNSILK